MAILDLLALYRVTRQTSYLDRAGKALASAGTAIAQIPAALPLTLRRAWASTWTSGPSGERTAAADGNDRGTGGRDRDGDDPRRRWTSPAVQMPGGEFEVIVKIAIKPGWHIYANPTGVAELNPTTLELHPESRKLVTMEKPAYPAGVRKVLASSGKEKVALYEKEVEIRAACVDVEGRQARFRSCSSSN